MACPAPDLELPETIEVYAQTAVYFQLALRSTLGPFPTKRVTAAFEAYGIQPEQMSTTDPRNRVYALTVYDPPDDVTYCLQEMLSNTGAEIASVKSASRALPDCDRVIGTIRLSEEQRGLLRTVWRKRLPEHQKPIRTG
jgi:hypothetical protein